jgi:hypothetical protein
MHVDAREVALPDDAHELGAAAVLDAEELGHARVHEGALGADHVLEALARWDAEVALVELRLLLRDEGALLILGDGVERALDRGANGVADLLGRRRRLDLHARARRGARHWRVLVLLVGDPPGQLGEAKAAGARAAAEELAVVLAGGRELGLDVGQRLLHVARHWGLGWGCSLLVLRLLVGLLVLLLARHGGP